MQQDLLRPESAIYYINDLQDISQELANMFKDNLDENNELSDAALSMLHLWGFESISSVFLNARMKSLGNNPDQASKQMTASINTVMAYLVKLIFEPPTWKIIPKAFKWFRDFDSAMETLQKISSKKVEAAASEIMEMKRKRAEAGDVSKAERSILEKLIDRSPDGDLTIAKVNYSKNIAFP